jgi:hypothetical protein
MKKITKIKGFCKATIALVVALAFILPGAAVFVNVGPQSTVRTVNQNLSDDIMQVENTSGTAGDTGHVIYVTGTWSHEELFGYELAMYYDATQIEFVDVNKQGTIVEFPGSQWNIFWSYDDSVTPAYVLATAITWGEDFIPAGSGNIFKMVVNIKEHATNGETILDLAQDVGPLPSYCSYSNLTGGIIFPALIDGNVTISGGNNPPNDPSNPSPADGATGVDLDADLSWTGGDPDVGDTVEYDVYFGTASDPPMVDTVTVESYDPGTMELETKYYWKIVARDNHGGTTVGDIWDFTTESPPNEPPEFSDEEPLDGLFDVPLTQSEVSVMIVDPEGDSFDWSIETVPDIGSASAVGDSDGRKSCLISGLEFSTTYTWFVNASDTTGSGETTEAVYTFTTMANPANQSPVFSDEAPKNGTTNVSITIVPILGVTIVDPEGDSFDWSIETSPDVGNSSGTHGPDDIQNIKTCYVYNLQYSTTYTWFVNATDTGSGGTTREYYIFTTEAAPNQAPVFSNESPPNRSTSVPIALSQLTIEIIDPEGDSFNWSIETDPDIGSSNGTDDGTGGNSVKTCDISGLAYNTTYRWFVSAADTGSDMGRTATYIFTTEEEPPNEPPVFSDANPVGDDIPIATPELRVTIEDPEGDSFDWSIECSNGDSNAGTSDSNGTKICTLSSGLDYDTAYVWFVNATDTGSGETTEAVYMFTTESPPPNDPPVFSDEDPSNGALDVSIGTSSLRVTIEDPEGDTFDWSVETVPDVGTASNTGDSNGTKTCAISGLTHDTTYTWFVNATDSGSGESTEAVYTFTTIANTPPDQPSNPSPPDGATDVSCAPTLSVDVSDPDGDIMDVSFYNASDDTLIGTDTDVPSGTTASVTWSGLSYATEYSWYAVADDKMGGSTQSATWSFTTEAEPLPEPDLDCDGELTWIDVVPGETITDTFTIENIGDPLSELDWKVTEWPDWGDWTFTPANGTDLTPEDGAFTIDVEVVAPDEEEKEFTGEIKLVNQENASDFCTISVSLTTPRSRLSLRSVLLDFLERLFERFPLLEQLLLRLPLMSRLVNLK